MSELALVGVGVGLGLIGMTVLIINLRNQLAEGWRRLFGEPGSEDAKPARRTPKSDQRLRARVSIGFYAFAVLAVLVVGVISGQPIVTACGTLGVILAVGFFALERSRGSV
jgi:hypothetical protein